MDPYSAAGNEAKDTDFGETLAVWGFNEGAYVELPIFGPSTERASIGFLIDTVFDPMGFALPSSTSAVRTGARIGDKLQTRHVFGDQVDEVLYESTDSYVISRLIYLQNRRFEIGASVTETGIDPYIDPYAEFE